MAGYLILPDGREVEVRDGLVLGRIAGADVVVHDSKASRRHAVVHLAGSVAEIEDLDSSNGTLLNGKKIQRRGLHDGDTIRIGQWEISYREGGGPRSAPAAATVAPPSAEELVFDDEVAPPPTPPRPSAVPRPSTPTPALTPPPPAAPSPPPAVETLEFLDEVVQVRPTAAPQPRRPAAANPGAKPAAAGGRDRGVLQFHKLQDRRGVLAEDLQQMSTAKRALLWLLALSLAAAMGYLAMQLAR